MGAHPEPPIKLLNPGLRHKFRFFPDAKVAGNGIAAGGLECSQVKRKEDKQDMAIDRKFPANRQRSRVV
jgi:hypothetical protein